MKIRISSPRVTYLLEIERKITVIKGNSGTGKSNMIKLLEASKDKYMRIDVNSPLPCEVINGIKDDEWEGKVKKLSNCIIFIEDEQPFVRTNDFAKLVKDSENYFVIITRFKLGKLPISIDAMAEFNTVEKKYNVLKKSYRHDKTQFKPDVLLMEDGKSGYEFMCEIYNNCITSEGKSKIVEIIKRGNFQEKNVMVLADGEAIGPEIEQLTTIMESKKYGNIKIELPYSFEYLLLHSPLLKHRCGDHLTNTQKYAGCEFNSWEQYYEYFIKQITENTPAQYTKATISKCYIENCCCQTQPCELKIGNNINKIQFIEEYFDHIDFSLLQKQNDNNLPTGEDDNNKEENNNNQEQKQLNWI